MKRKHASILALAFVLCYSLLSYDFTAIAIAPSDTTYGNGHAINSYVSDISFKATTTGIYIPYDFDPSTTDYEIERPAVAISSLPNDITIKVPQCDDGTLYYSFYKNGAIQTVTQQTLFAITGSGSADAEVSFTSALFTNISTFPIGETTTLSIRVGTVEENAAGGYTAGRGSAAKKYSFVTSDVYNFNITRTLALTVFSLKATDDSAITTVPVFSAGTTYRTLYDRTFSAVVPVGTTVVKLAASAHTSASAGLFVGDSEFTSGSAIKLSDFTDADSPVAIIPFSLRANAGTNGIPLRTDYMLYVSTTDYSPTITLQPVSGTYDKPASPLRVEAVAADGGELSYKWYVKRTSDTSGHLFYGNWLESTTEQNLSIPFAGTYSVYCVVTNSIGGANFTTTSETVTYTVNLNKPTAPKVVTQPHTVNAILAQNQQIPFNFDVQADGIYGVENLPYTYKLYRNTIKSTQGGEEVANIAVNTGSSGGAAHILLTSEAQNLTGVYY
jgi:hypothetical protein